MIGKTTFYLEQANSYAGREQKRERKVHPGKEREELVGRPFVKTILDGVKNECLALLDWVRNDEVRMALGSKVATVNGQRRSLPAAAEQRNGVTFVPLQFIAWAAEQSM